MTMFKKLLAVLLAVSMLLCAGVGAAASSDEASEEASGETVLDTEIPEEVEARITTALYLDGISGEQDAQGVTYTATGDDQSVVYAKNGAIYTLSGATLTKPAGILSTATSFTVPTGEVLWSTTEAGSYGINAVALAWGEGTVLTLSDCNIWTYNADENGDPIGDDEALIGANAVFATMEGKIVLDNVSIIAAGEGGHGMDVTSQGVIEISNSTVVTYGKKASGLTTDQPGGTIYATNVDVLTYKSGSAPVYCDGNSFVSVTGGSLESWVEPAAVVCTDGVLELTDVTLLSHEDAALNAHFPSSPSTVTCTGCTFTSEATSAVTAYAATNMVFEDCEFYPADGAYIVASIPGEDSSGNIAADEATVTMIDCDLTGGVWADEENGAALNLILEDTTWVVTEQSVLTTLTIDEESTIEGTMLVNGTETALQAGTYENVVINPA
ncbi:MAG: hypothetical protein LUG57_05040 [Oscillospiraceae bacterium]|nr:hypothetical protein [Oscillospiraceae bacterium]